MPSVNMLAPAASGTFVAQSGEIYTSDANAMILAVPPGDILSLTQMGCIVFNDQVVVTPTASSYIVPGAVNLIPATTAAVAYTMAAPPVGQTTTIVSLSTGLATITSSGFSFNTAAGTNQTVLTGTTPGTVGVLGIGSTLAKLVNRSINTSSAGVVYNITSS